jgi:peptidoglycan/LPS O-acetylase OafA/YrhL
LDGLRGVAILAVLAHHLFIFTPASSIATHVASLAEFCGHGVDLFFALSGFLIVRQLTAARDRPGWKLRFWTHRFAKIAPIYFACIALAFWMLPGLLSAAGFPQKLQLQQGVHGNWPWYVSFASDFLNAKDGRFTNPAIDVAWSLGVEVQFYLVAFGLFVLFSHYLRRWLIAAIPVAIACRCIAVGTGANWIQILVLPWDRLDAFALGGLVATRQLQALGRLRLPLVVAPPLLAALFTWSRDSVFVETVGYSLVALAAASAISLAADGGSALFIKALNLRGLRRAGAVSYSVYLTHLPVRAAIRDILFHGGGSLGSARSWLNLGAYYLVAGAACLTVGWLLFTVVEDPVRRRILQAVEPQEARPAA